MPDFGCFGVAVNVLMTTVGHQGKHIGPQHYPTQDDHCTLEDFKALLWPRLFWGISSAGTRKKSLAINKFPTLINSKYAFSEVGEIRKPTNHFGSNHLCLLATKCALPRNASWAYSPENSTKALTIDVRVCLRLGHFSWILFRHSSIANKGLCFCNHSTSPLSCRCNLPN